MISTSRRLGPAAACLAILALGGCAAPQQDRLEPINRPIHEFNETFDKYLLRPVAVGYDRTLPNPVQDGVSNFFSNLNEPLVIVNQVLQGKPALGAQDTGRFLINSTLGIAGFFDVASGMGLRRHEEDFGQTFGVWGLPEGDFLVVPFWGAVTVRSGIGDILDFALYPPSYLESAAVQNGLLGLNLVSVRANLLEAEELIRGDRYVFFRDTYLQRRDYLVRDGAIDDPFLDDGF